MHRLFIISCFALVSCAPENEFAFSEADKITCEADGSRYVSDPLVNGYSCVEGTSDAGKMCLSATECEGWCGVTREGAPGQCSAQKKMIFGCYDIYDSDGQYVSICI